MAPKSSECIKELDHFMKDSQNNTVDLKPENLDPNFNETPQKLKALFDAELDVQRTDAVVTKLGISSFRELSTPPHQLKIALVDLSGDANNPQYVGLKDTDRILACSLLKIAPIYAAHQLKFDAQVKGEQVPANISGDPTEKLKWIFAQLRKDWTAKGVPRWNPKMGINSLNTQPYLEKILVYSPGGELIFEPQFKQRMMDITHPTGTNGASVMNHGAGYLIAQIRYPYMTSALLKVGLLDKQKGGLWLSSGYTTPKWYCKGKLVSLFAKQHTIEATARAVATFLTLLAQGRLIEPATSDEIKEILKDGDAGWLKPELQETLGKSQQEAPYVDTVEVFGKHGECAKASSEGMLIERDSSLGITLRYVVVGLTTSTKPKVTYDDLFQFVIKSLIPSMDGVIIKNNTP